MHPTTAPPLHGPSDTLARAAPARPRPFLLAVAGASARGIETRGVEAVERSGRLVLAGLSVAGATCGNVLLAPAHARRELAGPFGTAMEILLLTPDGLVAQWTTATDFELEVVVPGASACIEGGRLTVVGRDGIRRIEIDPTPEWGDVADGLGPAALLRVRARMRGASGPARLRATSGGDEAEITAAANRLARAREAHAESDALALRTRRLATRTGLPELDDGLAWAAARLDAALGDADASVHELAAGEPFPFDPASRRAWTALGAVASGVRPAPTAEPASALGMLALARTALWRGERLRAAASLPVEIDAARAAARRAALLALADALEPWEGKPHADGLRVEANARARSSNGGLRLPTLGGTSNDLLASALDLPGRSPFRAPPGAPAAGLARALTAWAFMNDGAIDAGFALFRRHLGDGFAAGAGLWSDGGRIHDPAAAALVPLVFLDGLLGARADAHYGRLRLAPQLPAHWTKLTVGGIGLAGAEVRLDYEADHGAHRFCLTQESGATPVMVIFAPLVPAGAGVPVRIDGGSTDIATVAAHGRARLEVQLPLDRPREISIG